MIFKHKVWWNQSQP